jgi:hypothetical protein
MFVRFSLEKFKKEKQETLDKRGESLYFNRKKDNSPEV